jgi:hypothetical protein
VNCRKAARQAAIFFAFVFIAASRLRVRQKHLFAVARLLSMTDRLSFGADKIGRGVAKRGIGV